MRKPSDHKNPSLSSKREVGTEGLKMKGRRKEIFTDREWQELMGTKRDTYKRTNGAVRRR